MANMTWNQFKKHIDAQLEHKNISGDEQIWYIDISFPDSPTDGQLPENTPNCPDAHLDISSGIAIN